MIMLYYYNIHHTIFLFPKCVSFFLADSIITNWSFNTSVSGKIKQHSKKSSSGFVIFMLSFKFVRQGEIIFTDRDYDHIASIIV